MTNYRNVIKICICQVVLFAALTETNAQNLSFTRPGVLLPGAATDKAVDITHFNHHFFVTWKQAGNGQIMYSHLGRQYDTERTHVATPVEKEQSDYGPKLRTIGNRMYILWISKEGNLKYIFNDSDTGFNSAKVYETKFSTPVKLSLGISAGNMGDKAVLAAHTTNKNEMMYCVLRPGADGQFEEADPFFMKEKSPDYSFVTGLNNQVARFCWRSNKDDLVKYADYNTDSKKWLPAVTVANGKTKAPPVLYHIWGKERLFYIWRGNKNDSKLYYSTAVENEQPIKQTALSAYFESNYPVSVCTVDDNNFLLAYTGNDNQLYLSSFSNYDPANWMQEILHPLSSQKTLQDIVIPGAHDAGMSVLTAPGGQQPGTINECNTLTQKLSIGQQLNAGIRMFDLRAGTYNTRLHAKHCASDCMAEAIGGGYGEMLHTVSTAIRKFLQQNRQEIILLSFSHFCEKETPTAALKDSLLKLIGKELVYANTNDAIGNVPLSELAGKVIISFETENNSDSQFPNCSIANSSSAFINFKRLYAATNDIKILVQKEKAFFNAITEVQKNDIVRLDWQLTQSASEAPTICNEFENEKLSPIINGAMLLANVIKKNKSIIDHSVEGNKYLPAVINGWIEDGTIHKKNKPHILYVDVAGAWITDYCIDLNKSALYQ